MKTTIERLDTLLLKAMRDFRLIDEGDRVLIGLSGGSDSLCLTELLVRRSRIFQPRFSPVAVHVSMPSAGYLANVVYLSDFCSRLGLEFHTVSATLPRDSRERRSPCFLCSWMRRKALFEFAQAHRFNKIALGHHQDDIIQTFLLNLIFAGRLDTMPAVLSYRKMPLTLIRPLCLIPRELIRRHAQAAGYESQLRPCPHEDESNRLRAARLLARLEELNPDARHSLWHAILPLLSRKPL